MALTSTLHRFQIELSDIDCGVYESLDLRVARHPSEDEPRVIVRVLAYAVAYVEGLEFGRGLSTVEDPALWHRSETGEVLKWIDVGIPSADRLHRAAKQARSVVVFTHKPEAALKQEWSSRTVHRAAEIDVVRFEPQFVDALAEQLDRTVAWYVTVQDAMLSVAQGEASVDTPLHRSSLADVAGG